MKGFTKKLTTVLLVLLMLTQQVPVTRVYAEDNDVTVIEEGTTQANENGSTENTGTGETVSFAEEGDPTVTEGEVVPATNEGTTGTPTEGENGDLPGDPDDPVEPVVIPDDPVVTDHTDDEGETSVELITDEKNELHALSIQGPAAMSLEMTAAAIEENTDLNEEEALEAANELFALSDEKNGRSDDEPEYPRSLDDSNIENITVKWITEDTVDNGDDALLYVKPAGAEEQSVRLQINYALSGEHDYEPGDITITIPARIFRKRTGEYTGATIIPFPESPSTKNDFNWNLVGDNYVLTNTKHMKAATKGYIQIAFDNLLPYELVDMAESEPFDAYIQVVTHLGNTIALRSNELTAQFDTEARIVSLNKRAYQAVTVVPASQIPESQRVAGVEQYVKVDWYLWGNIKANTEYSILVRDYIYEGDNEDVAQYDGFIIGSTEKNGHEAIKTVSQTHTDGNTSYITFSTAYPLTDQFELDHGYTFKNNVEMTITEIDPDAEGNPNVQDPDPKLVTSLIASATKYWVYHNPEWIEPRGHFNVFKNGNDGKDKNNVTHHVKDSTHKYDSYNDRFLSNDGYYGIYGNALNKLRDGEDYEFSYTVNSIGYIMPWTYQKVVDGPDPETTVRMIENWFNRPVRMVTADDGVNIERFTDKLTVLEDYEFVSLEFLEPRVYSGVPKNINPDGSWKADTYDDGTFEYTIDRNKKNYPDIDLELLIDSTWTYYATASWKSGSLVITLADGSTQTDPVVTLPSTETENWRTKVIFNNAALEYDVRPVIRIKSTDTIKTRILEEFEKTNTPVLNFYNSVTMVADQWDKVQPYDPEQDLWTEIVHFPNEEAPYKDGYDRAHGYTTDTAVYPSKSSKQRLSDANYDDKLVTIHYSAKVEIRSTISDKTTYEQAIEDGELKTTTHAIWRDLLPKGVTPVLDTVALRKNDSITSIYTIEDFRGSGRTMLVVEADLTPTTATYKKDDMTYYEDAPTITFDAIYSFDSIADYGDYIHNVISFESNNEQFGTIENYIGEPDDPYSSNNIETAKAFANNKEKDLMKDLADHDNNSFVYAGTYTKIDLISAARTSLSKEVSVNNDGIYSSGVWYDNREENERVVYTGGQYTYQIRMMADDSTITSNIRIYDSLENFYAMDGNDPIDIDSEENHVYRWQGTLRNVDVSQLIDKGCDPIVYYSTIENLQLADEEDPKEAHATNVNLDDTAIWVKAEDYTGSLSDVKAIAVDATYSNRETGALFELDPLDSIVILINMQAPSGKQATEYVDQDAHAYNNAYMLCKTTDAETGESDDSNFVRKDYTKVGLEPYEYNVEKIWLDDADRDGLRPFSIIVHLLANGVDTGYTLVLSEENDWKGVFEGIPYSDANGKIHYSVKEEPVKGYTDTYRYLDEKHAVINNRHLPERITLSGIKTWVNDDSTIRPDYIIVRLYGNNKLTKQINVQADANGNWSYSFADLYKYENGEEIDYRVEEEIKATVGKSYVTTYSGMDIINTYHPYGDLLLHKLIENTTDVSEQTEFGFTFVFTKKVEGETEPEPVLNSYEYEVLDEDGNVLEGRNGTVSSGETVYIKGNETLHIIDIDEHVQYKITEERSPGFVIVSSKNLTGTINPNQTSEASITNKYSASGKVQLDAVKVLYNKVMKRNRFSFEVYEVTIGPNGKPVETLVKQATNEAVQASDITYREDGTVESSKANVFFGAINYTEADAGTTHTYRVKEINTGLDGYTYSEEVYTVEVEINDNGDGTLDVQKRYYNSKSGIPTDVMVFENIYSAEGSVILRAWKELKGREVKPEEFTFELFDEDCGLIESKSNDENGAVAFTEFEYDETDIGKTFYYVIREQKGNDDTVKYSEEYFAYKIEIEDYDYGQLNIIETLVEVEVTADENGDPIEFTFPVEEVDILDEDGNVIGTETVNKEGKLPVFLNTLEPGSLSITKWISEDSEDYDPNQEFVFHVKLIGEEVPEGKIDYVLSPASKEKTETTQPSEPAVKAEDVEAEVEETETAVSGREKLPLLGNPLPGAALMKGSIIPVKETAPYHADEDSIPADSIAYAVYNDGTLLFFRSMETKENGAVLSAEDTITDIKGNVYSTGTLYTSFETGNPTGESSVRWANVRGSVTTVKIAEGQAIKPVSTAYWFSNFSKATTIDLNSLDTSNVTNMAYMFNRCSAVKTLDVGHFDTSNVTNMSHMFYFLWNVKTLDVGNWDTSSVTNMSFMFDSCYYLETLDVSKWNTSNVTTMEKMFGWSSSTASNKIKNLDVSKWNTSKVTNMKGLFNGCYYLETLDVSKWNTSSVTDMMWTFERCFNLDNLDVSKWNTDNVTSMYGMFASCESLTALDVSKWNTEKVTGMAQMFSSCSSLKALDVSNFKTSLVTSMSSMFSGCSSLTELDVSKFETANVSAMEYMFSNCSNIEKLDLSSFDTSNVRIKYGPSYNGLQSMFYNCSKLQSVTLGEKFSFVVAYDNNVYNPVQYFGLLPTPPVNDTYTGKWIKADGKSGPYTPEELRDIYNGSDEDMRGTWIWHESEFILNFKGDEETLGSMASVHFDVTKDYTLPECTLIKYGYRFHHWSQENDETITYGNGAVIPGGTYGDKDKITLIANFEKVDTTVEVKNGEFELILRGGEMATFNDLPAGTSYQIWEETPDGWILVAEVNSSGVIVPLETQNAEFTNKYQPDMTSARIHGTKMLDNAVAKKDEFTFELYEVVGDKETLIQTVKTLDGGFIQFERIDYTKADIGTHVYKIRETDFKDDSIDYDMHEETVTVTVEESEGMLISRVAYDNDGVGFINRKRPGSLRITKVGEGVNDVNKDDEFTFKITLNNESGMPIDSNIQWYVEGSGNTGSEAAGGSSGDYSPLLRNPLPLNLIRNIGPLKEGAGDTSSVFHVDDNDPMMSGTAYAIIYSDSSGSHMLFFRSSATYTNNSTQTVTINGVQYSGRVYAGFENSLTAPSWRGSLGNVIDVKIADGFAIKPISTARWFSRNDTMPSNSASGIRNFDLSRMDTSNVTTMQFMFKDCKSVTTLDLSTFDTGKLRTMDGMFAYCSQLSSLNLSSFNTSNLQILRWTFINCSSLESLDLSTFDTSKVISYQSCFEGMSMLKILKIGNFDVSGYESGATYPGIGRSVSGIFSGSRKIEYIELGPNFKFYSNNLPTPSSISPYTGKWIRIDGVYGPYNSSQLTSNYNSSMAGTWVWQLDDSRSIIYFNPEGGYVSPASITVQSIDGPVKMPDHPVVQRPGFTIVGWNTKADGSGTTFIPGNTYTYSQIGTKIGETVALYAQWAKGENWRYTVNHYKEKLDGSDYDLVATEILYAKAVPSEADPDVLEAVVTPAIKTEYQEEGFYLPESQTVHVKKDGTTVVDYYYSRSVYDIIFDGNGADSGGMNSLRMQSGVARNLPLCTYQKIGSIFTGWNTKEDGTGDSFADGQQVKNLIKEGEITLYAQWLENENEPLTPTQGVIYVTAKAGQTIVIPNLPNGTTYTIEEVNIPEGWSLDEITGATGVITSNHVAEAKATNIYEAKGEAYIVAYKKLADGDLLEDQFAFELLDENENSLQIKTNDAVDNEPYLYDANGDVLKDEDGNPVRNPYYGYAPVYFDAIEYDEVGTYHYTIKEVESRDPNVEMDESEFHVTVEVIDAGKGKLEATVTYDEENGPMFVNRYYPGSLVITKKIVNGDEDQEFSFVIHLYDKNGNEIQDTFAATVSSNGKIDPIPVPFPGFGEIEKPTGPGVGKIEDVLIEEKPTGPISDKIVDEITKRTFKSGDTITISSKERYEIMEIPAGTTYTVEEIEIPNNWTLIDSQNTEGTILSGETIFVEFTNQYTEVLFADLIIEKELESWESGSPVTFIFDVVAEKNGETVYADVHSLTYDSPGKKQIVISELPAGANVTVREVYAGAGYKISGSATQSLTIDPDKLENKASFTNTYDKKKKRGYGAQNTFTTEDGETWTWVNDLEEGGE